METNIENVVRLYGDDLLQPTKSPQELSLPSESPSPNDIHNQRKLGNLTMQDAADACGVNRKTWRRWENGNNKMPKSTWGWFSIITSGAAIAGGPDWEGWSFHQGKLYSPEGWGGFTAGELRSWPYLHAQLAEHRLRIRGLEAELEQVQHSSPNYERGKAVGQLDALGATAAQLMTEYEKSDDLLLQKLSNNLYDALKDIVSAQVPLIKAVTNHGN